ncbi:hypothetical protein SAMN05414137_13337 [Streptacidiphilus jiangxiensis]|uniref:Uncharacterized protein n=1 Tax=Streptacidiphilus jiangxiensis TaxID=235985 RepID=A0A1H7Z8Y9_STRJI|nr:hypothetical protein SAMN05414137_13337 [Streptacidiphilus jiangxiensis]
MGCALVVQVVAGSGDADVTSEAPEATTATRLPAHARSKPLHWIATAAGVGAVVGLVLAVGPAGAVQTGAEPTAGPLARSAAPDAAKAKLPIDCGPLPVHIDQQFSAALPGAGTPVTVVAARCDAGAGSPPDGLYALEAGRTAPIQLLDPAKRFTVRTMAMRGDGSIHATVIGYSSTSVPDCCPDLTETLDWSLGADGAWAAPVVTGNAAQV